jgi:hypothetical protein
MGFRRGVVSILAAILISPISGLCNGIVDFGISGFSLTQGATISSVSGSGGVSNSGTTLSISNGSLNLTSSSWLLGGTLDIVASGTIGDPLDISGPLLTASFKSATLSGSSLTLNGFSGSLNGTLAGFYGMGTSVTVGSVYISGSSAVLAVDPTAGRTVATPEAGGLLVTLGVVLAGVLTLFAAARRRIIRIRSVL